MYSCGVLYTLPTVTSSSRQSYTPLFKKHPIQFHPLKTLKPKFTCSAAIDDGGPPRNWEKWLPKNLFSAEKVLKSISEATSSPICQFISSPTTFLHTVDPRIKLGKRCEDAGIAFIWTLYMSNVCTKFNVILYKKNVYMTVSGGGRGRHTPMVRRQARQKKDAWLVVLVVLPARSNILMRFGLVAYLSLLSILILPRNVWMDQLGRVSLLSGILFIMLGLGADGAPPVVQLRTPPPSMMGLPSLPASLEGYSYIIMKLGPLQLTRKGLSVASTSASLTFSIFQSASLCLSTTTPEQLAFALQWYMRPLAYIGVPVSEVILTLLLSLRFINLVFDEVRVVALGIVSRRIYWEKFTALETIEVFFTYIRRIFSNIFSHAEQISQAMNVRGFRGDSNTHNIYFSSLSSNSMANIASVLCLVCLVGATAVSDCFI